MFIEPNLGQASGLFGQSTGWIEVICGSMFSGKTEELIRRLNRALIAKQKVEIFKPAIDNRYHERDVVSHDQSVIRSTPVQFANDILLLSSESQVVGIDEAQFFDAQIVKVANTLAYQGKRVILAGLDMDYTGKAFFPMTELLAIADFVTKTHAICMKCGNIAGYSFRTTKTTGQVLVGEKDIYEARCRKCFLEGLKQMGTEPH